MFSENQILCTFVVVLVFLNKLLSVEQSNLPCMLSVVQDLLYPKVNSIYVTIFVFFLLFGLPSMALLFNQIYMKKYNFSDTMLPKKFYLSIKYLFFSYVIVSIIKQITVLFTITNSKKVYIFFVTMHMMTNNPNKYIVGLSCFLSLTHVCSLFLISITIIESFLSYNSYPARNGYAVFFFKNYIYAFILFALSIFYSIVDICLKRSFITQLKFEGVEPFFDISYKFFNYILVGIISFIYFLRQSPDELQNYFDEQSVDF